MSTTAADSREAASGWPVSSGGPIRRRLTLALVGVSIITLVAVGSLFFGFLGRYVIDRQKDRLLGHAVAIADQVDGLSAGVFEGGAARSAAARAGLTVLLRLDLQVLPSGASIVVFDDSQVLTSVGSVAALGSDRAALYAAASRLARDGPAATTLSLGRTERLILAAAPATLEGRGEVLLLLGLPTSDAIADRQGLVRVLLLSGVVAVGIAVAIGMALGSWLSNPLRRLARSARAMAGGSLQEPVTGSYPGEVYEVAVGMEALRREVQHSEESLRAFVGATAHELKTPLTSIQGFSQALLDGTAVTPEERRQSAAAIYRESGRLRRLVDALLTLSRFDSREFRPNLTEFDAQAAVAEEAERLVETGLAEPGRIELSATGETRITTDLDMFRQIAGNLLRNAVQYGAGTPVVAVLEGGPAVGPNETSLALTVSNGGPGLSAEDRAHVFERFYRGREAHRTEGFGLGLPLVREICRVLGGDIQLLAGGSGVSFRVVLPLRFTGGSSGPSGLQTR